MLHEQAEKIGAAKVEIRASQAPMGSRPHEVVEVVDELRKPRQRSVA